MKKLISIVLFAAMLASSFAFVSFADGNTPNFSIGGATVEAGESFTIPVYINNNPGICGTKIFVYFDPALTCTSITKGSVFPSTEVTIAANLNVPAATNRNASRTFTEQGVDPQNYNSACVSFVTGGDANTGSGLFVNVTMTAPSEPGTYFVGVIFSQGDTFNVVSGNTEYIQFTYSGNEIVVESAAPEILLGDVNGDTKINGNDIKLMKKYIAGSVFEDGIVFANSDINADGKVNGRDFSLLKKLVAGASIN